MIPQGEYEHPNLSWTVHYFSMKLNRLCLKFNILSFFVVDSICVVENVFIKPPSHR